MKVREWLEEKDYWKGVELFCSLSDSAFLKQLFKSERSSYIEQKLEIELRKYLEDEPTVDKPSVESVATNPQLVAEKKYNNQFILTKLKHELQQVYRQIDDNRFALERCRTERTRRDYALQILELVDKKRDIYAKIDHFQEHGCLPDVVPKKTDFKTPELQRLYVQVSKMKRRLEKPDEELRNRAKSEQKLREKLARIEELKGELV